MLMATDLQRQTLRLYGELLARSDVWGGKLVFTSGEGASATGLPAAVSIAGGTTLVLDPEAATVKAVFRNGGIDFVVNTLDEERDPPAQTAQRGAHRPYRTHARRDDRARSSSGPPLGGLLIADG